MFAWFRRRRDRKQTAQNIYGSIVAQAREPDFYSVLGVPDTLEGRFEILVIHLFLASQAIGATQWSNDLPAEFIELFIADMDVTMRELGISDIRVPKKMRELSSVLHDRLQAYRAAFEKADPAALIQILKRHVCTGDGQNNAGAAALALYMFETLADLSTQAHAEDRPGLSIRWPVAPNAASLAAQCEQT